MTFWQAMVLGIVQGLTEFLPVSSSGHLALAENLFGLRASGVLTGVLLDVSVHVATLAAILVAFREPIARLAAGAARGERRAWQDVGRFALASVPAAIVGLLAKDEIESLFSSLPFLGAAFLATGTVLWATRTRMTGALDRPSVGGALVVGLAQAVAIAPGISRSGATISAGLFCGLEPVRAAEFSFVLGVPAIAGAAVLEARHAGPELARIGITPLLVACAAAFATGLVAIAILRRFLRARAFHHFAPYLWMIGAASLIVAAVRGGA